MQRVIDHCVPGDWQGDPNVWLEMWDEVFRDTYEHEAPIQQAYNVANESNVRGNVLALDPYITQLAEEYNCRKALILTPMVHEDLRWNDADAIADLRVRAYYLAMESGLTPSPEDLPDSSTGLCQIFAKTAIIAHNFALSWGLTTGRTYDYNDWENMWGMWKKLQDNEFNLKVAMFVMMRDAQVALGVPPTATRDMTPSQVMRMCVLYNGTNEDALIYGRNRMSQYYTICK